MATGNGDERLKTPVLSGEKQKI